MSNFFLKAACISCFPFYSTHNINIYFVLHRINAKIDANTRRRRRVPVIDHQLREGKTRHARARKTRRSMCTRTAAASYQPAIGITLRARDSATAVFLAAKSIWSLVRRPNNKRRQEEGARTYAHTHTDNVW